MKRDALLFANSIGCTADELHFVYVSTPFLIWVSRPTKFDLLTVFQELDPNFAVFPTYPIVLRTSYPHSLIPSATYLGG